MTITVSNMFDGEGGELTILKNEYVLMVASYFKNLSPRTLDKNSIGQDLIKTFKTGACFGKK